MYFTSLPDHKAPGFDERLHFSKFGKHNIVFKVASNNSHCDRHIGCLSIKTVLSGMEWYGINHQQLAVRPGQFLILNDEQEYSCRVDESASTTTVSVFFSNEFAAAVWQDALNNEAASLDNFQEAGDKPPEFFQTLTEMEPTLQQQLFRLVSALDNYGYSSSLVDERLVFLLRAIIQNHKGNVLSAHKVISVKLATRIEIYKRLCMAKDFMHSTFNSKVDLSLISSAACLSIPQLVRQFSAVFHVTPHQYLTQIRLAHAAELLKQFDTPINEITWVCGFENTSAFCRAFKTAHGIQPTQFRKMNR
jgi:AraC family transcriptional regulator